MLQQYYVLLKESPKLLDSQKLVIFLVNYNPTLEDAELYMETVLLAKNVINLTAYQIITIMQKCRKVTNIETDDEWVFEYFSQLFCAYLLTSSPDMHRNLAAVEIFKTIFLERL